MNGAPEKIEMKRESVNIRVLKEILLLIIHKKEENYVYRNNIRHL